jgi:repressor LexA
MPENMQVLTQAQKELYDWLIEYIRLEQHAPSIRQMMRAMNLKSPAPIQSRLERLRSKGYIDWTEGKARTMKIVNKEGQGIPILGSIAAGGIVEPSTDVREKIDLENLFRQPNCYALKVVGDSMIDDRINEGDLAIMRSPKDAEIIQNGEIVAARVEGVGTTLKRFYQEQDTIILKASNPKYEPIRVMAETVDVQGILIGIWRSY